MTDCVQSLLATLASNQNGDTAHEQALRSTTYAVQKYTHASMHDGEARHIIKWERAQYYLIIYESQSTYPLVE